MITDIIQKKNWTGIIQVILIGVMVFAYAINTMIVTMAHPVVTFLAGAFGIGVLMQSFRLTKKSQFNGRLVSLGAIIYFVFIIYATTQAATTPNGILNGLATASLVFMLVWYYRVIHRERFVIDEVHVLSVSLLAWVFFYNTSSWWWYGTVVATAGAIFALLRHGQIPAILRFLLFGWFTVINALLVWLQFKSTYETIFSIADIGSNTLSSSLMSEMFAAGLAVPVALFPLFHAFLVLPLVVLIIFGGNIRSRIQEFREHVTSLTKSVENVATFDWCTMGVVGGIVTLSILAIVGIIEKTLAVNVSYALIGLRISLRTNSE